MNIIILILALHIKFSKKLNLNLNFTPLLGVNNTVYTYHDIGI